MKLSDLRRPSLARRLVLLAAGWSLIVLLVAGYASVREFRRAALARFDRDLTELREGLYSQTEIDDAGVVVVPAPDSIDQRARRTLSGKYWQVGQIDNAGRLEPLVRSRSLDEDLLRPPPASMPLRRGKAVFYDAEGPRGAMLRITAYAARFDEDPQRRVLVFMAAEDRAPVDRDAARFAATTAIALLILIVGLAVAIIFQVRIGLRPLFALQREVATVRKGQADRVAGRYPVELAPLADELNALLAHNQEVVERQRTHVGNLAHALKTPLSVMRAEAEARPGPLADVVARQAQAMHDHVDHHLRRARAAARTQGQRERTEIEPVIDELAVTLERIFRDKPVTIDWRAPEDLHFQGERQDLLELVGNVMENACKWSAGKVKVTATPLGDHQLSVVVEDDGPGLPPDRRAEVMRRGARLDEETPGSGLGLSIVDELARAYGGKVLLGDSKLGGLSVELQLPRGEA